MGKKKPQPKTFHYPVIPSLREDGPWYEVNEDVVTWRGYETDADPATFVALTDAWGIDDDAVYVQYSRRRKIDRGSFRLLNPVFGVDKHAVYEWRGAIKNADPRSFEALDAGTVVSDSELLSEIVYVSYARDKQSVWFQDQMAGRASALKSADPATFQSFRNGYGADATTVYYGKLKLNNSDPASWIYLGRGFSMDHARVWFLNRELKGVRRENFFVVKLPTTMGLATDGNRWFRNDSEIEEAQFAKLLAAGIKSCTPQAKQIKLI